MKYRISHVTRYQYRQMVSQCYSEARLQPRDFPGQRCLSHRLEITPECNDYREYEDFFGNRVTYFSVQQAHRQLSVNAVSEVCIEPAVIAPEQREPCSWEESRRLLQSCKRVNGRIPADILAAKLYSLDTDMAACNSELLDYAAASFISGRSLYTVALDLTNRIYQDFSYDPGFTSIATPLSAVLAHKRGVCQDFAHLAIACFRCFGLPARYVSGYIETTPPAGVAKLAGSDASHAWFSVFQPGCGWLDFDPTNDCKTVDQHITLAWGRDYKDVTPLKGLAVGGREHAISVAVDVLRQQ